MRFCEFNQHGYYGVVLAIDEEWAKKGYQNIVADLDDYKKDINTNVTNEKQTLERYIKVMKRLMIPMV